LTGARRVDDGERAELRAHQVALEGARVAEPRVAHGRRGAHAAHEVDAPREPAEQLQRGAAEDGGRRALAPALRILAARLRVVPLHRQNQTINGGKAAGKAMLECEQACYWGVRTANE